MLWPTFYIAPTLYLAQLSAMYALVPWACASQHHGTLHLLNAVALAICLAATVRAYLAWQSQQTPENDSSAALPVRRRFVAFMGLGLSALMCLALIAQWITVWKVPLCVS
jgi:hypothetical protein